MTYLILAMMGLAGAAIGGGLGWRGGSESLSHAIDVASAPPGTRGRDYRREVRRQRKLRRWAITIVAAVVGGALGLLAAFVVALLPAIA
jgi:hypothetical protein